MRKLRFFFIYLYKFIERKSKLLILIGIGVFLLLLGLIKIQQTVFTKATLSEGVIGTYTEKNLPEIVTTLLSDGLVKTDSSGKPIADLAASWTVNEGSTEYTFKLKPNLIWADGTPVSAYDFEVPLSDVEVTNVDKQTINFKLSDNFSPFPNLLEKPLFKKDSMIGTGPYKVKYLKKDNIFVNKLVLESLKKDLPDLVLKFYPNEKIAKEALRLGEVQSLIGLNEISDLSEEKTLGFFESPNYTQLVTIFYNTKDKILGDENLRLALSFAAPVIKKESAATTSIPPLSWAFNKDVKDYLDNPEQSKIYLKKVEAPQEGPVALTVTSFLQDVGQRVVEAWNKNGIKAVLRVESGIPQNFQALLITQNIPKDPDQYSLWHSTQTETNISQFSNPRIDKDLEDGRKVSDPAKRLQNYKDFQKILLDNAPATFLYFPQFNAVYMKKVEPQFKKVLELQLPAI